MISKSLRLLLFSVRPVKKWHGVRSYDELHRLLCNCGLPASPRDFTTGPLRRFFDLALEPGRSDGQRCRVIEHARHWLRKARDRFSNPVAADALSKAINAELDRLEAMGANGRWVVAVFESDASHHAAPPYPGES